MSVADIVVARRDAVRHVRLIELIVYAPAELVLRDGRLAVNDVARVADVSDIAGVILRDEPVELLLHKVAVSLSRYVILRIRRPGEGIATVAVKIFGNAELYLAVRVGVVIG